MPSFLRSPAVQRAARRGVMAAWKGRKGTTFPVLLCTLTLLQLLLLGSLGAHAAHASLLSRAALYLEVLPDAKDQDIQEVYAALRTQPFVAHVEFVPSEKAYEREKARTPDVVAFLEKYQVRNPFPDSFLVSLTSFSRYNEFARFVGNPAYASVLDPSFLTNVTEQEQDVRSLVAAAAGVRTLLFFLTGVAALILLVQLSELMIRRIRREREDVALELLLGGSPMDVAIPLCAEMGVLLLASLAGATIIALAVLFIATLFAPSATSTSVAFADAWLTIAALGPVILLIECILLPLLALAACVLVLRPRSIPLPFLRA